MKQWQNATYLTTDAQRQRNYIETVSRKIRVCVGCGGGGGESGGGDLN